MNPFAEPVDWSGDDEVLRYLVTTSGDVSKERFTRMEELAHGSISMSESQILTYVLKELSQEAHHQRAVAILVQRLVGRISALEARVAELEGES